MALPNYSILPQTSSLHEAWEGLIQIPYQQYHEVSSKMPNGELQLNLDVEIGSVILKVPLTREYNQRVENYFAGVKEQISELEKTLQQGPVDRQFLEQMAKARRWTDEEKQKIAGLLGTKIKNNGNGKKEIAQKLVLMNLEEDKNCADILNLLEEFHGRKLVVALERLGAVKQDGQDPQGNRIAAETKYDIDFAEGHKTLKEQSYYDNGHRKKPYPHQRMAHTLLFDKEGNLTAAFSDNNKQFTAVELQQLKEFMEHPERVIDKPLDVLPQTQVNRIIHFDVE
jgi:hypothetical protein